MKPKHGGRDCEASDGEGRAWRLVIDPRVAGALYNGYDGTGYKGVSERSWYATACHPTLSPSTPLSLRGVRPCGEALFVRARGEAGLHIPFRQAYTSSWAGLVRRS